MPTGKFKFKGTKFEVKKSPRKNKQLVATFKDGKKIHFGDPKLPEFPGTKRGDNFCSRSLNLNDRTTIKNANSLSRKILWKCKGKKSKKTFKEAGIKRLK